MITARDEKMIDFVLENEGGYVNNPKDPGGATNWGITLKAWSRFTDNVAVVPDDIKAITKKQAYEFYKETYWRDLRLEEFQIQKGTVMLDCAVNRGTFISIKNALMACHSPHLICVMNEPQLEVIARIDLNLFLDNFHDECIMGYEAIVRRKPDMGIFLKGWKNRADKYLTFKE